MTFDAYLREQMEFRFAPKRSDSWPIAKVSNPLPARKTARLASTLRNSIKILQPLLMKFQI